MTAKISHRQQRPLLAPSGLVSEFALRCGYDMGVAATAAGELKIALPDLDLDDDAYKALRAAVAAVESAHEAYFWTRPLSFQDYIAMDLGCDAIPTAAERLDERQTRLHMIREAVAEGDIALPALMKHALVLTVTTQAAELGRVPSFPPAYPFSAVVSVEPLG